MHGVITGLKVKQWMRDLFRVKKKRIIVFSPKLYLGDGIERKSLGKLKKRLCKKPLVTNVCLLILSENESDQLDIISSKLLAQTFYEEHSIYVVGMARTKSEAVSLTVRMTEDCISSGRDDCSLKEFLTWQ